MDESSRTEELQRWKTETAAQLEATLAELAGVQQRVEACRERLRLLDRLLAIESGPGLASDQEMSGRTTQEMPPADDLLDVCERVVLSAGRPLHIKELHAALLDQGIPIPGRGTEANLLVRLHRSNGRFIRTGRGTFAPAAMGTDEVRPTRRRRVRTRGAK